MPEILIIATGGAVGASLRYLTGLGVFKVAGTSKVYTATVVVNILGCFTAGLILAWIDLFDPGLPQTILFLTTGILGSYTTFSTFALEALELMKFSLKKTAQYLFLQVIVAVSSVGVGYGLVYVISV